MKVPMHCDNCAERIESRVGALRGVRSVHSEHEKDVVTVEHTAEVFRGSGETVPEETDVAVDTPLLTWPGGKR